MLDTENEQVWDMLPAWKDLWDSFGFHICSEWAAEYRIMQGGKPYSLHHFPYVVEIMNSKALFNWIKKGAQTGLTETAITIGEFVTIHEGKDVIYYFPMKKKMDEFSQSRIDDSINLSPFIKKLCTIQNRDMKKFGNATLFLLGANSSSDLKSTSAGRLIMDEFDEWTPEAVNLAIERTSGQIDNDVRIWGFSTPKHPDCGIDAKFKESTKEFFFFGCPHCKKEIDLSWHDEVEEGEEDEDGLHPFHCMVIPDDDARQAYYRCWRCKGKLEHEDKPKFMAGGKYRSKTEDNEPCDPDPELFRLNRGFYVPQMLSPGVTPEQFAAKYLKGKKGDIAALREFHNSGIGEPYLEGSHRITDTHLIAAKRIEPYSTKDIGRVRLVDHKMVTLGIDQGGPVHHWAAVSWKFDRNRFGDPNDRAIGKVLGLGRIMCEDWDRVAGLMRDFQVRLCTIDYNPNPEVARKFARRFPGSVYLCMYTEGHSGREIILTEDDYGANVVKCDRTAWLSKSLGRIMAGDLKIPTDASTEFDDNLKAPIRTMHKDKVKAEYLKGGPPDHYAHAINYAEIALKVYDPTLTTTDTITR